MKEILLSLDEIKLRQKMIKSVKFQRVGDKKFDRLTDRQAKLIETIADSDKHFAAMYNADPATAKRKKFVSDNEARLLNSCFRWLDWSATVTEYPNKPESAVRTEILNLIKKFRVPDAPRQNTSIPRDEEALNAVESEYQDWETQTQVEKAFANASTENAFWESKTDLLTAKLAEAEAKVEKLAAMLADKETVQRPPTV